ncbi:MAG TPA: hypothetical protein LFW20_01875 [Rickettsia endosymbiont of Omalisus fontisbellaquei]|nr:hypothetical protein [Rickettsia endosymbiont of Omalisus fontisbellaquei]
MKKEIKENTKPFLKVFFSAFFSVPLTVIIIFGGVIFIGDFLWTYFIGPKYDFTNQYMADVVNSTLEIPYFKKNFVINRPENIKTLTKEEWMSINCQPVAQWSKVDSYVFGTKSLENLPKEQKRQLNCVSISDVSRVIKVKKEVSNELCSNHTNCQTLNLAIESYILQYPKLLQSIIKIAERPCDFIKVFDEKKDLDASGYTEAKSARNNLCKKNYFFSKLEKFVLITIINHKKPNIEIIVRRKDVD